MNLKKYRNFCILIITSGAFLTMSGCSHGVFRNRELDYLHATVKQNPPLQIPAGVHKPKEVAYLTIPNGQYVFLPQKKISMAPPDLFKTYSLKTLIQKELPLADMPLNKFSYEGIKSLSKKGLKLELQKLQNQFPAPNKAVAKPVFTKQIKKLSKAGLENELQVLQKQLKAM